MSQSLRRIIPFALLAVLLAGSMSAAPSRKYEDWRKGPVQWLMTEDEVSAWKKVRTDQEAIDFIDLFWAKRDPSPGTPENAYRQEFNQRVKFADERFKEGNMRGAMTDRGRVYIVLGSPTSWGVQVRNSNSADSGTQGMTEGGSRLRASKDIWLWEGDDARRHNRPKIEVVFVQKVGTDRMLRDPFRADFMGAGPASIEKSIVNKGLTSVPSWAIYGGLDPKVREAEPVQTESAKVETVTVPFPAPSATNPAPSAAVVAPPASGLSTTKGASRFTLIKNVYDIDTETGTDPFKSMKSSDAFTTSEDLGWATQYCAPEDEPLVRFALLMTGKVGNEIIERAAPPDEMVPDRIRSMPGCFMLRGAIPLEGMTPGSYELEVQILDAADNTIQSLKRPFRIE